MEYEQAEKSKKYIEQFQAEAFERGFRVASEQGQMHGHWIDSTDKTFTPSVRCSNCLRVYHEIAGEHLSPITFHYCPYCGAKMDEEVE